MMRYENFFNQDSFRVQRNARAILGHFVTLFTILRNTSSVSVLFLLAVCLA